MLFTFFVAFVALFPLLLLCDASLVVVTPWLTSRSDVTPYRKWCTHIHMDCEELVFEIGSNTIRHGNQTTSRRRNARYQQNLDYLTIFQKWDLSAHRFVMLMDDDTSMCSTGRIDPELWPMNDWGILRYGFGTAGLIFGDVQFHFFIEHLKKHLNDGPIDWLIAKYFAPSNSEYTFYRNIIQYKSSIQECGEPIVWESPSSSESRCRDEMTFFSSCPSPLVEVGELGQSCKEIVPYGYYSRAIYLELNTCAMMRRHFPGCRCLYGKGMEMPAYEPIGNVCWLNGRDPVDLIEWANAKWHATKRICPVEK